MSYASSSAAALPSSAVSYSHLHHQRSNFYNQPQSLYHQHQHQQQSYQNGTTNGVPIPRPSSQVYRPKPLPLLSSGRQVDGPLSLNGDVMESAPNSASPSVDYTSGSGSVSPFPFSPRSSISMSSSYQGHSHSTSTNNSHNPTHPASYASAETNVTSPPSSLSFAMPTFAVPSRGLSYPSVPPPSLSSSFGSVREASVSPVEPLSRRGSITGGGGVGSGGTRRGSLSERRSRAGSLNQGQLPETVAEGDSE